MRTRWLCVCLALMCLLGGCGRKGEKTAAEVVAAILPLCGETPTGVWYRSGAERGQEDYISATDFDLLYGEGSAEEYGPFVREYSIYLSSFAEPFEVAVFRCYEKSDADRVGGMLLRRSDRLKVFLREIGRYETDRECICVTVVEEYAILVMCHHVPDKGKISRAVK